MKENNPIDDGMLKFPHLKRINADGKIDIVYPINDFFLRVLSEDKASVELYPKKVTVKLLKVARVHYDLTEDDQAIYISYWWDLSDLPSERAEN